MKTEENSKIYLKFNSIVVNILRLYSFLDHVTQWKFEIICVIN